MKNIMNAKNPIRITMIAASLALSLSAIAAEPKAHSDGVGTAIADAAITTKVKGKLMAEEGLKKSDITVTTTNHVVTLDGSATSADAKTLAETTVKTVDDVKSVDNNLKTPDSNKQIVETEQAVSDSMITTQVKADILANSFTKALNVEVETTNGVVVLKGMLDNRASIEIVKDIAQKVKNVKSVDISALTVINK